MAEHHTAAQMKQRNIEVMGPELGARYTQLWQRVARMQMYWAEYVELFGKSPERVVLMNDVAPAFFRMLQDELYDATIMHISRITDQPVVAGHKTLTIRGLPKLMPVEAKVLVGARVKTALEKAELCRDRRNRQVAHDNLDLALENSEANPLVNASRKQVAEALKAIADVMNAISMHFYDSETMFVPPGHRPRGAVALLYAIRFGAKAQAERTARVRSGKADEDDWKIEPI